MERKITLKELAKLLSVSISTVSKALNDSNEINPETKARIQKVAKQHNYVPNEFAQSLKGKRARTIGVVIPDVLAQFFAKSLHGIETTASRLGYKILICISNESTQKEAESIKTLVNGNVDGIIMSLAKETQAKKNYDHFRQAVDLKVPIVLFDRVSEALDCDKIAINDFEIAAEATKELYESGCRNIIYLSTIFDTSVDEQRQGGYLSEIEAENLQGRILHIKKYETFEENLLELLRTSPVDGILAADELSAISAMRIAIQNGYKIPEEISVIGFTNGLLGENFLPSLTTVEQYAEKQGGEAVELLVGRIEETIPAEPVHRIIKTKLLHRDSTRSPLTVKRKG